MSVLEHCKREPITAGPGDTVRDAAKRMAELGVGAIIVTDSHDRPVGLVTDRDIVQKVVRRRRDPDRTSLEQIMSLDVVNIWDQLPVSRAFNRMRQEAVRRVVITDDEGKVSGILTFDDALPLIAGELSLAAEVVRSQTAAAAKP
jgi:CBS domain-containing protein